MQTTLSLQQKLERISTLDPDSPGTRKELARYLAGKSHLLAARAAQQAARFRLTDLSPNLIDAFERFMFQPDTTDRGCAAKTAIVEALTVLEYRDFEVYLRAARHVQLEPVWGGKEDMAGDLRAAAVLGLMATDYPHRLEVAVDLLADPLPQVRAAAVRSVAASGNEAARLLLRLKARAGDSRAEVTGECLRALLLLDARRSLPLALEFLDGTVPELAEAAALAIGEARIPDGLEILKARLPGSPVRAALMLSIAMLRSDEAAAFLHELAERNDRDAGAALKLYGGSGAAT